MYSNLKEFYLFDQNTFTGGGSAFETKKILKIDEDIYYSCKCIEKKSMKKPENLEALKMEI